MTATDIQPLRFGIAMPQFVREGGFDPPAFRRFLTRAEALDFESAWTQEQVLGTMSNLGAIEAMTYAAACTERLRLGCAVFVFPLHVPVHLAKSLATLDQLSRGRLEVGLGIGGRRMFSAFGVDPAGLVARFNEGLQLMKTMWTESSVDFDGRFWQVHGAAMEPKPVQKPHPPIWFGGNHPDALRRAVRHASGFFGAGSQTTAQYAQQVQVVRAALSDAGRDPASFRVAKRVYITIDDDVTRAEQNTRAALQAIYGYFGAPDITPVSVFGTADDCVRGLRAVADAGAQLILLNPLFDELEQMERLMAEVVPHLTP